MKRILPISKRPYFQVFSYHTFLNAITLAGIPEDYIAAKLEVKNFQAMEWRNQTEELTEHRSMDSLSFEQNSYATKMNACYYRKAMESDEIEIKVLFQEFSNPWGAVNVFLTTESQEDMLFDDGYLFRFGNFNRQGIYLRYHNVEKKYEKIKVSYPYSLILKKDKRKVSVFYREEGGVTLKIHELLLGNDVDEKELTIGFEVKLGNHTYYEWLYSNYIQIYGNPNDSVKMLDFYGLPYKDWYNYFRNYNIDYNIETQDSIRNYGFSFLTFAKKNIDYGRYVETWLNQFHVRGRSEYKRINHFHQNLIYGYDDEKEVLLVMGFDKGRPSCFEISYEDFENVSNYSEKFPFWILYTYSQDYSSYQLNIPYLKRMLKEYLDGTDSSMSTVHIVNHIQSNYGMRVYDAFLTEKGITGLFEDLRVSQLLFEHKKCMKDRIEYLIHRGCLPEWTLQLSEKMKLIYTTAQTLRNLIVKSNITAIPNMREQGRELLSRMKELEEELYPILIDELTEVSD